jgi:hypothetical protein
MLNLFAIGMARGDTKSLDMPGWFDYGIFPLALAAVMIFVWRKKAAEDDDNDDDKPDK